MGAPAPRQCSAKDVRAMTTTPTAREERDRDIVAAYESGDSIRTIAAALGLGSSTVYAVLCKYSVPRRASGKAPHKRCPRGHRLKGSNLRLQVDPRTGQNHQHCRSCERKYHRQRMAMIRKGTWQPRQRSSTSQAPAA